MAIDNFDIRILDLHWIKHVDDPSDRCAHGHVFVKINDEIICDKNDLDITVSATALYLMRTLTNNYKKDDYASQLLPCCGHLIVAENDNSDFVNIIGCPNGIDWTIIHIDDNSIKHISESGKEAIIDKEVYKGLVLNFADQVENFYKTSLPKTTPKDDSDKKGYQAFWKEWRMLRSKWS